MIQSTYFKHLFFSSEMEKVFNDRARIEAWLEAEVALAKAEAALGIIPSSAAEEITKHAKYEFLNLEKMREGFKKAGFPIIPFVKTMMEACPHDSAKFIHFGSTSQDIQDTGTALQLKKGMGIIENRLNLVLQALIALVERSRGMAMAGRSFQQQAAPITFGFKAAVWLDEFLRHKERLKEILPRLLTGQCGGAVGTLATLGEKGILVREKMMEYLRLNDPDISWHPARDRYAELINWLSMVSSSLAKIGQETALLMRSEVQEVFEPSAQGRGTSSTMPQKRNPVICEPIIAICHKLRELAVTQNLAMIQDHERGVGHMHMEWMIIPEAMVYFDSALMHSLSLLEGLELHPDRMLENIRKRGSYLMSESVMMSLADKMGRQNAHHLLAEITKAGLAMGMSLEQALRKNDQVKQYLNESALVKALDPLAYLGTAQNMIDTVLAKAKKELKDE